MKWSRPLVVLTLSSVSLAAVALAGLYWASHSERALRWAVTQLAGYLPGRLSLSGVHGSLSRPITIEQLSYVQAGFSIQLREIELEWSPRALLMERRLLVHRLSARALDYTSAQDSAGTSALPQTLALPLPVEIAQLELRRLRLGRAAPAMELGPVSLSYRGGRARHDVQLARFDTQWGSLRAALRLDAAAPFALNGSVEANGVPRGNWVMSARGTLSGNLTKLHADVEARVGTTAIPVKADVLPFEAVPLQRIAASVRGLDLARLVHGAPHTSMDLELDGAGSRNALIAGVIEIVNQAPGPVDRDRVPLRKAGSRFSLRDDGLRFDGLRLAFDQQGSAQGSAWTNGQGAELLLALEAINLRHFHSKLRATSISGEVALRQQADARTLQVSLTEKRLQARASASLHGDVLTLESLNARIGNSTAEASGRLHLAQDRAFELIARTQRLNPADVGDFPTAGLSGRVHASGHLEPHWYARIDYRLDRGSWRKQPLEGAGRLVASAEGIAEVDANLYIGRSHAHLTGAWGQPSDQLSFDVELFSLAILKDAWSGTVRGRGTIGGSLTRPNVKASFAASNIVVPGIARIAAIDAVTSIERTTDPAIALQLRAQGLRLRSVGLATARLTVNGRLSAHLIEASATGKELDLHARLRGATSTRMDAWEGAVLQLEQRGDQAFRLEQPASLSISKSNLSFGPAALNWTGGRVELGRTVYGGGRLDSSGRLAGFPASKLLALLSTQPDWTTSLVLGARWHLTAADAVSGHIEIFRERGDVVARIEDKRLALGIEELVADVDVKSNRVTAVLKGRASNLGELNARGETRLVLQGKRWGIPGNAPLSVEGRVLVPTVSRLASTFVDAAHIDGSLSVQLRGEGTVSAPRLRGSATADAISIEQIGSGVFLRDGSLHADFDTQGINLRGFSVKSGDGRFDVSGSYSIGKEELQLQWSADKLAAVQLPDLLLVTSGSGTVTANQRQMELRGRLQADKGRVEVRDLTTHALGNDVVIVGAKPRQSVPARVAGARLDLALDLGNDFRISGRGLDARLGGQLRVRNAGSGPLQADGRIEVRSGTYEIYGRKLEIERGIVRFAGAFSNPALDIRAVRKNQQVEAGVEVTGTANKPEVRLVSVPEVPDMEKLSWITLGRKSDSGNRSDTEMLQRYAAAMAANFGTASFQSKVAQALGLDEISIVPGTDAASAGGLIQVGKRLSDRIYVLLEQRLSTAGNAVKVNYQFARDWSLRLESGETDAVDVFYTFSFD